MRIIQYVTTADTEKKIDYYVNATKALLYGMINNEIMFRIFSAIYNTLSEDLEYMTEHIEDKDHLIGNLNILALSQIGLVLIAGIHQGEDVEEQEYVFSSLAYLVDRYAVALDNEKRQKRYQNRSSSVHKLDVGMPDPISNEEIEQLLK